MSRKKTFFVLIGLLVASGLVLLYLFNPESEQFFPQCPFHYLTGLDCPGCGSQRAFHSLLHLKLGDAFAYNPLFVLSIPYLLTGIYFEYFGGKRKYPKVWEILFGRKTIIVILLIIIIYWIGRNVCHYL